MFNTNMPLKRGRSVRKSFYGIDEDCALERFDQGLFASRTIDIS